MKLWDECKKRKHRKNPVCGSSEKERKIIELFISYVLAVHRLQIARAIFNISTSFPNFLFATYAVGPGFFLPATSFNVFEDIATSKKRKIVLIFFNFILQKHLLVVRFAHTTRTLQHISLVSLLLFWFCFKLAFRMVFAKFLSSRTLLVCNERLSLTSRCCFFFGRRNSERNNKRHEERKKWGLGRNAKSVFSFAELQMKNKSFIIESLLINSLCLS